MATTQPDPAGDTLAPVLAAIQRRDPAALAQLYEQTADRLYGLIHCLLNNAQDAEDVLSELFLAVWHEPQRYDATRGPVIAWLMVMARSRALDLLRRHKHMRFTVVESATIDNDLLQAASHASSPIDMLTAWQEGSRVQRALSQLSDIQRHLILLAFFKGLSHAEIAASMDLPLGTVKSHLRRAQQTLEQLLNEFAPDTAENPSCSLNTE
ncbi:MAG: RNA polymerase sigma factor [Pseudomonadota bacterium]